MRIRSDALIIEAVGCRRVALISCLALISVCLLCTLYLFAPVIYYKPEAQRFLDGVKQLTRFRSQAQKESDLIAFVCDRPKRYGTDLYSIHPDGTDLQLISGSPSKTHYSLNWSSDGIWMAMNMKNEGHWSWSKHLTYESHHSEIYKIRFDGSMIRRLTYNRSDEHNPQWSNDGESILFDSDGLHSISADGGEIQRINQLRRGSYSLSHNGLLLSILHNRTGDPALDYRLHQDSSGLKLLVIPEAPIAFYNELQWLPNDEAFFYVDEYKGVQVYNTKTLLRMDTPSLGRGPASWSPNGKWLAIIGISDKYAAHGDWTRISDEDSTDNRSRRYLYLLDMNTGQLKAFVHYIKYVPTTWSPDSEWIAFVSSSNDGQLFKIKRDGTGLQQLTNLECSISEISWSPK